MFEMTTTAILTQRMAEKNTTQPVRLLVDMADYMSYTRKVARTF